MLVLVFPKKRREEEKRRSEGIPRLVSVLRERERERESEREIAGRVSWIGLDGLRVGLGVD